MLEMFACRVSSERLIQLLQDEGKGKDEWLVLIADEDGLKQLNPRNWDEAAEMYSHTFCGKFDKKVSKCDYHSIVDRIAVPTI